ncbi:MAG: carbohydrate ABC transporter permease [Vallitaleaceae bacterium]|nr:carbohydrate ABC transporter permease [Vallitaleaceae bacterium]
MSMFENKESGFISAIDLKRTPAKTLYFIIMIFAFLLILICCLPPLWVLLSSLKDTKEFFSVPATLFPKSFHPEKLVNVWKEIKFTKYFINSIIVVAGSVGCALVFNSLIAYAVSVLKPKGSQLIYSLILISMMIPATISIMTFFKSVVDLKMMNSFVPLWFLPGANAFFVILYKQYFDTIPRSYIEAAKMDGCSKFGIYTSIIMPMSKAVNAVIIIFSLNTAWSDFLIPYLILRNDEKRTVVVKLFNMSTFPHDYIIVAMCFTIIPPIILFLIFQKSILSGIGAGGIKG